MKSEIWRVCLIYLVWVSPYILHYLCLPGFFQFSETLALLSSCQHKMCDTEGEAGAHGARPAMQHSTWTPPGSASGSRCLVAKAAASCEQGWSQQGRENCFFPLLSHLWHHNWGAGSTLGDPYHKTPVQVMGLQREWRRDCSAPGMGVLQGSVMGAVPLNIRRRQGALHPPVYRRVHQMGGTEAGVQVPFRKLCRTERPPRLLLGLVPNTAGTQSRFCAKRRGLVVQGSFWGQEKWPECCSRWT